MTSLAPLAPAERLPLVERRGEDFPFYDCVPARPSALGWLIVLAAVALSFAALTLGAPPAPSPLERALRGAVFLGLPLAALALAVPGGVRALVRPLRWRDLGVVLICLPLGLVVSAVTGAIVAATAGAATNPAGDALAAGSPAAILGFFAATLIQLPGEEVFAILPFLGILAVAHGPLGLGRRSAVLLAWVLSSLIFGAAHLPTYDWNWVQCFVVIGIARIFLTLSYVITKNLVVSSIVHILNDWLLFGVGLALSGAAAGSP